ncbi:MAG: glycerate kinase [Phycisphaerae bacterium]
MKVVIAPDTFKETLAAGDVAAALAEGVLEARPDAQIDLCPMADGGGGTVAAMVAATGGRLMTADVFGPLGEPVRAHFGMLGVPMGAGLPGEVGLSAQAGLPAEEFHAGGEGATAVIEMASASGLPLVPAERRDPLRTTTFGTGQLILAALEAGARKIIIGIGGSATNDGGAGCAQALGVVFTDGSGRPCICGLAGGGLADVEGIDISGRDERVAGATIRVACDVTNPLTGPAGAAAVYGPQKGATPEVVAQLDANLRHFAEVIRRVMKVDVEQLPGAGAAGGLGAGLVAFAGARLEPGLPMIAQAVGLARRLKGADLCITGEGRLDRSSSFGKTAVGVSRIAAAAGVPVLCVPGQATPDAPAELFAAVHPLVAGEVTVQAAMRRTRELLRLRAAEAVRART